MTGRQHFSRIVEAERDSIVSLASWLRTTGAIWSRALADRLVGPVERWCPMCELELKLQAAQRVGHIAASTDDE